MKTLQSLKIAATFAFLLFAVGATAQTDSSSSGPSASSESVGQHVSDGTITAKAKAELIGAKDIKATGVHVKTRRGVVWLTGAVPSAAEKQRAQELVEGISGVRSVKNRLKVVEAGADE